METTRTRRLFFALWPDDAEHAALAAWQPLLQTKCGGRAMRPQTLHCTLAFLGAVAERRLEALRLAAQEVAFMPFTLDLVAAHYWGHNRIVYAAPAQTPRQLAELVASLQRILHAHRFRFDAQPYTAHVTLLRGARWTDDALPPVPVVHWQARDFVLVQSLGDNLGARYELLCRFGEQG